MGVRLCLLLILELVRLLDIVSWGRHVDSWLFYVVWPGGALGCASSGLCTIIRMNRRGFVLVQTYGGVRACSPSL